VPHGVIDQDVPAWAAAGPPVPVHDLLEFREARERLGAILGIDLPVVHDHAATRALVSAAADALESAAGIAPARREQAWRLLHQLDRRLLELQLERRSAVGTVIAAVLPRLEAAGRSVAELVSVAPELVCELGFDRAMISRVEDNVWYPELMYVVGGDLTLSERVMEAGNHRPTVLQGRVPEVEVVHERQAVLVTGVRDPDNAQWGHQAMIVTSGTRSYVAAPIVSGERVVGLLHADRYEQRRHVDEVDRDMLSGFAACFRLALSRAALNERLVATRLSLTELCTGLAEVSGAVDHMPLMRAARRAGEPVDDLLVRTGPRDSVPLTELLTGRELEVLALMSAGATNLAIAHRLTIAEGTAKKHVLNILHKLQVANRSEAVARWFQSGAMS
jgi:DNA-binding CsgD family transcriptional regulator/GAF domain-containing protein